MKIRPPIWFCLMAISAVLMQLPSRAAEVLTAPDIIQKAVARGQQDQQGSVPDFIYRKLTVTEELDTAGKVKEHREKLYEISYRDGLSHAKLLQVNGHAPSDADLKQQSDNEGSVRQLTGEKKRNGDNRENFLTADLAARFDFTVIG